jgi:hypothetical protein
MTADHTTATQHVQLLASPQPVDCHHSWSSGRALLSRHRTSTGTVSYLRCTCGAWLVLLDGRPLATVEQP